MQLRHADRFRTLETNHRDKIRIEFACAIGSLDLLLRMKNTRWRADPAIFRRDRADLDHRAAEIAVENLQAAVARKRIFGCTQDRFVAARRRRWPESKFPFV